MVPIYFIVGIVNIFANMNNYNIPDDPELRNIRVRRDSVASINQPDISIKALFQGDLYSHRSKRNYYFYNPVPTTTPYYGQSGYSMYNNGYQQYTVTTLSNTHKWQYNPYNIPPKDYNQQQPVYNPSQPVYNQPQPVYNPSQPVYNQPQPVYNLSQPVYNQPQPVYNQPQPVTSNDYKLRSGYVIPGINVTQSSVIAETTTPRIACILCNIECPKFMKRMGIFCVEDNIEADEDYF